MTALRMLLIFLATIVLAWLGWNAAVALGIGWQPLPFAQALSGGALFWLMCAGFWFAVGPGGDDR